jgi:hypothetical protein
MKSILTNAAFAGVVFASAVIGIASEANASSLTGQYGAAWLGNVTVAVGGPGGGCCVGGSVPVTGPGTTTNSDTSVSDGGTAVATVQGNQTPFPSVTATAQITNVPEFNRLIAAAANIQLVYYIEVAGPTGFVNVDMTANGTLSSPFPGSSFVSDQLVVGGAPLTLPDVTGSFTVNHTYSLFANQPIEVLIWAAAETGGNQLQTVSAYLDPFFFIDPSVTDPSAYSIITSEGIGNSPATTPLPAALPLFATGLGALGLLGWRRKRKASAALATA